MATPKVLHGARCRVELSKIDENTGQQRQITIGIWTTISYSVNFDVQPSYILGRFSPAALTTTGVEPVTVSCSGWRVVDHSVFKEGGITELNNLLIQEDITFTVIDRQSGKAVATITGCLPTGVSGSFASRALSDNTANYVGLLLGTEDFESSEPNGSTALP